MIRILKAEKPHGITITVDGQLVEDSIDAVEMCCYESTGQGRPILLFLRDVSHIDEHGRALLSRLSRRGVELSAIGVYSSYIVAEVRAGQRQNSIAKTG